jgi:hypothetical protein
LVSLRASDASVRTLRVALPEYAIAGSVLHARTTDRA